MLEGPRCGAYTPDIFEHGVRITWKKGKGGATKILALFQFSACPCKVSSSQQLFSINQCTLHHLENFPPMTVLTVFARPQT